MATDFSAKSTDVETQIEPAARVIDPVNRSNEVEAVSQIGKGIGLGAKTVATYFKNKNEVDASKKLADFSVQLNALQDAEAQGLSSTEVRTRSRALLTSALSNDPNREEDYLKRYSTWLDQSGVSQVDTMGVQQAKIREAQNKALVDNGFISADDLDKPQKVESATRNLEAYQRSVRELEQNSKEISNKSSRLDLSSKERDALKKETEDTTIEGLKKIGSTALPYWRVQYENIKKAAAQASTEQERQQIIKNGLIKLDQDFAQQTASISGSTLGVDQNKIDQILQPQKNLLDAYKKELSGEYDTETFKKLTDNAEAQAKFITVNKLSPEELQMVTLSNMFKENAAVLSSQLTTVASRMFSDNSLTADDNGEYTKKPADVVEYSDDNKAYLGAVSEVIKSVNSGKASDGTKQELVNQVSRILQGVDVYKDSANSAKEFQPLIDFFSNPEVGKYMQSGDIPQELRAKTLQVFQDGYDKYVVPMIKSELDGSNWQNVRIGDTRYRYDQVVEPTVEAGRFGFKLKPEFSDSFAGRSVLRQLNNSSLTKVINKMVISKAHLEGNTDYRKAFEELAPVVFDKVNTPNMDVKPSVDKTTTGSVKQDFNLKDLAESNNPDIIQEVLDARDRASGMSDAEIEVSRKRGYTPDIGNLKGPVKDTLLTVQQAFGKPLPVVSGYRDKARNEAAGGAKKSQHIHGNAIDIDISDLGRSERVKLLQLARASGFTGIGVYPNSFHFDMGATRSWGPSYHNDSVPEWARKVLE